MTLVVSMAGSWANTTVHVGASGFVNTTVHIEASMFVNTTDV